MDDVKKWDLRQLPYEAVEEPEEYEKELEEYEEIEKEKIKKK